MSATKPALLDAYGDPITLVREETRVWLERPLDGLSFDQLGSAQLPPPANPPLDANTAVIIDFTVDEGFNGVIDRIANIFIGNGFADFSGGLFWQILIDGVPVPYYDQIPGSLGSTALPSKISGIPIKAGQRVQLVVLNASVVAGGASSAGRLGGWFYPADEEPQGGPF